ncbi:MAG: PA2778 family cysteine peptidase [Gammaproteobacteria bacterium]|nr:PA2778 family cysteine peptidase [Gammaproteobacteria bacterium]
MCSHLSGRSIKCKVNSKRTRQWLGAFLFLGFVSACTTPRQTLELSHNPPAIQPRQELSDTPFFPQTEYHCGPAALASVMQYRDIVILPEQIAPMIYTPGLKGALQVEVVAATRRFDLLPVVLDGKFDSLLREVEAGNPVLVLQNLGLDAYPFWHYAVVVGYDLDAQTIVLRSGTHKRLERPFDNFERTWARAGNWALVIVKPQQIPITANVEDYLSTVLAIEQAGRSKPANAAYASASRRWPDNLLALTGLGNTTYALSDYAAAERVYRQALVLAPQSHQIWNNLAYALAQQGKAEESMQAVQRALQLSPDNANYQQSVEELQQLLRFE